LLGERGMTITNFKNISTSGFDEDVLTTSTSGESIINFGRLKTTGELANGIFADADDVSVRNFGTIETSGLGATAIFVEGSNAHIDNYGKVTTHGDDSGLPPFTSDAIVADGDGFRITNYGSVITEGFASSALVGIGSHGVIVNYGRVDSSGLFGAEIIVFGDGSQVINAGEVVARGDEMGALNAIGLGGEATSILNLGRVQVTGSGSFALFLEDQNGRATNTGVVVVSADEGSGIVAVGDGNTLDNTGLIDTHGTFATGIRCVFGVDIDIRNEGRIVTDGELAMGVALGLRSSGIIPTSDGEITNAGAIKTHGAGAAGVIMVGDGHQLINSGHITTDGESAEAFGITFRAAGAVVSGDHGLIENTRTGVIESNHSGSAAVELNVLEQPGQTAAGLSSELDNFGLIKGTSIAVLGGAGQETVVNHGRVVGNVALGDGADTFIFAKGGSLSGDLYLGGGDDLVRIEKGAGSAHIADFAAGPAAGDVIDVSAFFASLGDLKAHSSQHSNDVVVDLGRSRAPEAERVNCGRLPLRMS
jgi:hypothetical protein